MNKRRSKIEWRQLIDEQAASGLSQKAFCGQRGIPLASFGYWKRKLRAEPPSTPTGSGTDTVSPRRRDAKRIQFFFLFLASLRLGER